MLTQTIVMTYSHYKVKVKGQDLGHYLAKMLKHFRFSQNGFTFFKAILCLTKSFIFSRMKHIPKGCGNTLSMILIGLYKFPFYEIKRFPLLRMYYCKTLFCESKFSRIRDLQFIRSNQNNSVKTVLLQRVSFFHFFPYEKYFHI